ncbi:Tad domain-containing protein [Acetobacter orientalis]|uniref:Tad domain-containing protein n=1 Tax=Acetobacter orientalis TaxID=146474 RepID=UPI0039EC39DA
MRKITEDNRGGVAILFALLGSLLLIATGVGVDYGRAMSSKTRLDAAADSVALFVVSHNQMNTHDSGDTLGDKAVKIFLDETRTFAEKNGVTITGVKPEFIKKTDSVWEFSLSYTALSKNYFAQIFGQNLVSFPFNGQSQTHNERAPDTDFYFLLDTSMSMAFPTTQAGLQYVAQQNGNGCTFACHYGSSSSIDSYQLAKANKYPLRIDEEIKALTQAAAAAKSASAKNRATYRFAVYQFNAEETWDDASMQKLLQAWTVGVKIDKTTMQKRKDWIAQQQRALVSNLDTNLDNVIEKANTIQLARYAWDNCPVDNTCDNPFSDYHTSSNNAFIQMNKIIPTPGTGLQGGQPQNILFVVTDGMRDEHQSYDDSGAWVAGARDGGGYLSGGSFNQTYCDNIKKKGTRIAILYTEYLKESVGTDWWSLTYAVPYIPNIEPALQACASPGLLIKVSTGDDIGGALATLFNKALATAVIQK